MSGQCSAMIALAQASIRAGVLAALLLTVLPMRVGLAQTIDPLVEQLAQSRIAAAELQVKQRLGQVTPEQYRLKANDLYQRRRALTSQLSSRSSNQQAEITRQAESLYKTRIVPLQEQWNAQLRDKQLTDQAANEAIRKQLEVDAKTAGEFQAARTLLREKFQKGEIPQEDFQAKDKAAAQEVFALQRKYDGYGSSWSNAFSSSTARVAQTIVQEIRQKNRLADTTSEVGKDAHRAAALRLSILQNEMRRAYSAVTPQEAQTANAPLESELAGIQSKYVAGAALAASAGDLRERVNSLVQAGRKDQQEQWRRDAQAESERKRPRASPGVQTSQPARPIVRPTPQAPGGFVAAMGSVAGLVGSFVTFLFWVAVIAGGGWLLLRLRGWKKRRIARGQAEAMRKNVESWEKLGATAMEREKNLKKMFDNKEASVSCWIRYDIKNYDIISDLQRGRSKIQEGFVTFHIRRNVGAMEPRERECLRTAYLLHNAGLIELGRWLYYSFAFINGDGKASIENWQCSGIDEINDGPSAVRFFHGQINGSVESAVNQLLSLVEEQGQRPNQPAAVKEVRGRLRGGGSWFTAEDAAGSAFADDGPYALRLGVLDDGSQHLLTYGGDGSLITIAPPGSGKTQCFVLPNLLRWPGPAVVLDVKGEIYDGTSQWRSKNVGPVFKFSPLDPAHSHSYNPLVFIRQDPEFLWEDSRFLADMMIVPAGGSDPFWENMSRDVLTAAVAHVCYQNPPDQRPLSKVMDLVYGIGWDDMTMALKTSLAVTAMRQVGHSLADMEKKTRDSVLKTAQTSLSAWQGERLSRVTRKSDWNPLDLRTTKATIYLCINPNEIDSYLSVLRVFIAQHIRMLTSQLPPRDAAPVLFVLDELPRLKKMPPVDEGLSIGRQYGIRLWMFAQSYGQLKEAYTNAEGMLGSCAVRTFMNVPLSDEIAQKLSDQLGFRDGPLDATRTKLVEPIELAGPNYRDIALVLATNTKPARVQKAFAYKDQELIARMGSR